MIDYSDSPQNSDNSNLAGSEINADVRAVNPKTNPQHAAPTQSYTENPQVTYNTPNIPFSQPVPQVQPQFRPIQQSTMQQQYQQYQQPRVYPYQTPTYNPYNSYQGPPYHGYYPPPVNPSKPAEGLGIAALVLGLVSSVLFWIPFIGLIVSLTSVIFGAVAKTKGNGGMAIAGIVLGIIFLLLSIFILVSFFYYNVSEPNTFDWNDLYTA